MRNILVCTCIIIGTIIGAGFASGQEIVSFFNRFGEDGKLGIIITCILFGIISVIITNLVRKNNISNYKEMVNNNQFFMMTIEVFSLVCFCIMVSGISTFLSEIFNLPFIISSIISGVSCYIILLKKFKGMEKLNMILVPLIIIGIIMIGTKEYDISLFEYDVKSIDNNTFTSNWLLASILYTSYNTLILLPVLTNFSRYSLSKIQTILIGIFTSFFLFVMAYLIYKVCNLFFPQILGIEFPTLKLAMMHGKFLKLFYCLVILFAIFTTAFSTGYSFLCMKNEKNYNRNVAFICIFAVLFSKIGFSNLINTFFPLFGYLGIIQIVAVIFIQSKVFKKRKE